MADVKMIATRESYGNTLKHWPLRPRRLVVLDADLAAATKTGMFRKAHPDRHFDCGIAEANMMGVAAGCPPWAMFPSCPALRCSLRAVPLSRSATPWPTPT